MFPFEIKIKCNFIIVKTTLHQSIAIALALMVVVSTVSWTVEKHLCMGKVVAISLFTTAQDCGAKDAYTAKSSYKIQNSCCAEESFTLQGQDTLTPSWNDLDLELQYVLVAFAHVYLNRSVPLKVLPAPHEKYSPPILIEDIPLLDQVFLI